MFFSKIVDILCPYESSKSSVQIAAIVDKMMSFQVSKWRTGFRTDDDFFFIKEMNCNIVWKNFIDPRGSLVNYNTLSSSISPTKEYKRCTPPNTRPTITRCIYKYIKQRFITFVVHLKQYAAEAHQTHSEADVEAAPTVGFGFNGLKLFPRID
ncbi:uncharacterized protein ACN427_000615 [Glossina fuscipes fuscipes]